MIESDPENFQSSARIEKVAASRNVYLRKLNYAVSKKLGEVFLNCDPKFCTYYTVSDIPEENNDLKIPSIPPTEVAKLTKTVEISCPKLMLRVMKSLL